MTSDRPAPALALIRRSSPLTLGAGYLTQVYAVADAEIQKLRHDPSELFTRALQPAIWLLLFGQVMAQVRGIAGGGRYLDFLAPGILAQSVLFAAIFFGIAAIWERDLGVLHRYMVSPAPRSAIVLGKAASSAVRGLAQAVIVYLLAVFMGIDVTFAPANIAGVAIFIAIGSALFSTFSLIIACIVKTRERFMGIGQVLTMPIFFASNAIYPIDLMPGWLKAISSANPLTYEVDGLRTLMLTNGTTQYGLGFDFTILAAVTALLVSIAAHMYPRLTR
ncbi:ABC transporter permease [Microvirga sp. 2TAF3]|uniref:ABC transporter permease n=1 Tax=Microvirga sp. 2TAF3 TaxID=3233014 RepID=UPI003F95EC96